VPLVGGWQSATSLRLSILGRSRFPDRLVVNAREPTPGVLAKLRPRSFGVWDNRAVAKLIPPVVAPGAMTSLAQPTIAVDADVMLRPFRPADVGAVRDAFTTPDIEHWHFRRYGTDDEAAEWIAACADDWSHERCATWAIVDRPVERVAGRVSMYTHLEDGWGEVSYWVLPWARARGIATQACVAATQWAHGFGLHRIELQHSVRNEASARVARRAGFTEEGIRWDANLHDDGWHAMRVYGHLATDPPAPCPR
jgi:ribosomal-protein-alanine N-acetyltransferase